jgi:hypothetical protein
LCPLSYSVVRPQPPFLPATRVTTSAATSLTT